MCGIAGVFRPQGVLSDPAAVEFAVRAMTDSLVHRGPDADGLWADPRGRCALGHRRLSIIDLSDAGLQPRVSADGRWVITFNGEIYNYRELGRELEAAGVRLRTATDTEVLIEAIALWGGQALPRLDGMFAFAAFDTVSGELLLARDPFGEKPLYVAQLSDGSVAFASELQAVERAPGFQPAVSADALAEYFSFQYIGAPRTIYTHVAKVEPGAWMRISPDGSRQGDKHFVFRPSPSPTRRTLGDLGDELEALLAESLERRLISDAPLGAFLSGGVDSSVVCALIRRKLGRPLTTFCMGFPHAPESEHLTARAFAARLGCDHHDEVLSLQTEPFLRTAGELLDEPNADSSCLPTLALSTLARRFVTVAVSGDGGDELFGGYGRYFMTLDEAEAQQRRPAPGWRPGRTYYSDSRILIANEEAVRGLMGPIPTGFSELLHGLQHELDAEPDLLAAMRRTDVEHYLPGAVLAKVDRMSMRRSLEVRTPFLSRQLARFAERLPSEMLVRDGLGKRVLREMAYRYLPRELIDLPKRGFGVPMVDWARSDLVNYTSKLVLGDDSRLAEALGRERLAAFVQRNAAPGGLSAYQVWSVAVLESWLRARPAVLPNFTGGRLRSPTGAHRLDLHLLGADLYLAQRRDSAEAPAPPTDIPPEIATAVVRSPPPDIPQGTKGGAEVITLPDWGDDRRSPPTTAPLRVLEGASVLFTDADACTRFDYREYERFSALGARRLVFSHPERSGDVVDLRLGPPDALRAATARRELRRLAQLTCRVDPPPGRPLKPLGASVGVVRGKGALPSAPTDLAGRYIVFEGARQLPPTPTSERAIVERGGGRYMLRNGDLTLSETSAGRLRTRTYVAAPNVFPPNIALPMRRAPPPTRATRGELLPHLRWLLRSLPADELDLRPGDPVVVCTHSLAPGGAERQWVYLAMGLHDAGYDVTLVTYDALYGANRHYLPLLRQSAVRHLDATRIETFEKLAAWRAHASPLSDAVAQFLPEHAPLLELTAAFARLRPKAVFSQLDLTNLVCGLAAQVADVPRTVLSFRSVNPSRTAHFHEPWYQAGYRALARCPRIVLSGNSSTGNDDYAGWMGVDPARVATIPNAIGPEHFEEPGAEEVSRLRRDLGLKPDQQTVVAVMRLSSEKGPLVLLEAWRRIAQARDDVAFLLVGSGPLQGEIERTVEASGLSDRVHLLGRRDDVRTFLRLADLVMLSSWHEGMPNVLMEAHAMGTPVVSTRVGDAPRVAVPGRSGLFAEPGDALGLAEAALVLLNDPRRARTMGAEGKAHVHLAFSKASLVEGHLRAAETRPAVTRAARDIDDERRLMEEEGPWEEPDPSPPPVARPTLRAKLAFLLRAGPARTAQIVLGRLRRSLPGDRATTDPLPPEL